MRPEMRSGGAESAGAAEVWAARAWNVFNEGKPFSIVYPPMAVAGAALVGAGAGGALGWGLLAGLALSLVWARHPFPLRARALLWALLPAGFVVLEGWRAPGLLAVGLGGYAFFTVLFWGGLYYHLRTGAPRTNSLRFWRLVATNSDPTSGNALEQVPKTILTLSAIALVAQDPGAGSAARVAGVAVAAVGLGALGWRWFARTRLPRYPAAAASPGPPSAALARRVYVIVVDGCNRERLRQASALGLTPTLDRLTAEGTEYLDVQTAYPARTVVCFSSMLTGAPPAEHGMRSNFAPRLGVRVPSVFDTLEAAGKVGRLVGIAHLADPFPDRGSALRRTGPDRGSALRRTGPDRGSALRRTGPDRGSALRRTGPDRGSALRRTGPDERRIRTVTSVQPTDRIDESLIAAGREVVEADDPDLLVLQLLAADQLGHVRGTRNPEYLDQIGRTDTRIAGFLDWLAARGSLADATVVVMADHGQGRGIGGHGHLDWGESPVPFVVHGAGAVPGTVVDRPASVLELAHTVSALLGVPAPAAARGRPLVPALEPGVRAARAPAGDRVLAVITARDEGATIAGVVSGLPAEVDGVPLDVCVVDDGSSDDTAVRARAAGARVVAHRRTRGLGAALRTGLCVARDEGYAAALYLDGDGEYDPGQAARVLRPVLRGRAEYVLGSRFLGRREGMAWHRTLANRTSSALMGTLLGGTVLTDGQTGYRALGRRALARFAIAHDYNYAQLLTLHLHGEGIEPAEVPIDYTRRAAGRSFVRYGEYARRVVPAVARELLRQRRQRRRRRRRGGAAEAASAAVAVQPGGGAELRH